MTADGEGGRRGFKMLLGFLRFLSSDADLEFTARSFEVRLLEGLGLMPHFTGCVACASTLDGSGNFFSSARGGMLCAGCAVNSSGASLIPISLGTASFLKAAASFDAKNLRRIVPSRQHLIEGDTVISDFIRYHIGKELKTRKFMESMKGAGLTRGA